MKDKVKDLTPAQREITYLFNPDLAERCPHFPPKGNTGILSRALRPCNLTGKDCHFSTQAEYEECLVWIAYEKGKKERR